MGFKKSEDDDDAPSERSSLLASGSLSRTQSSKKSTYRSFAEVHDPNPRFYITKCHVFLTTILLVLAVAWISVSLVIGLPLVEEKWERFQELHPGPGVDS